MTNMWTPVELQRVDPARNMARYYVIEVQTDLFGNTLARRSWGRIGTSGQTKAAVFTVETDALREAARIERSKSRRGYVDRNRPDPPPVSRGVGGKQPRAAEGENGAQA